MEAGGLQSFYFQTKSSNFQSICELELRVEREEDCLDESESFHLNFVKFPMTCELWIGGAAPSTSFQPSWRGRDDSNESESFVTDLDLLVSFCLEYQCLIRS